MSLDAGVVHGYGLTARYCKGTCHGSVAQCDETSSHPAASDMYANDSQHCSAAIVSLNATDESLCATNLLTKDQSGPGFTGRSLVRYARKFRLLHVHTIAAARKGTHWR